MPSQMRRPFLEWKWTGFSAWKWSKWAEGRWNRGWADPRWPSRSGFPACGKRLRSGPWPPTWPRSDLLHQAGSPWTTRGVTNRITLLSLTPRIRNTPFCRASNISAVSVRRSISYMRSAWHSPHHYSDHPHDDFIQRGKERFERLALLSSPPKDDAKNDREHDQSEHIHWAPGFGSWRNLVRALTNQVLLCYGRAVHGDIAVAVNGLHRRVLGGFLVREKNTVVCVTVIVNELIWFTDHVPTTYQPPTDHVPTTYQPHTNHIPTTYRLRTDHIPTTYRLRTDHLPTTYRPPTNHIPTT